MTPSSDRVRLGLVLLGVLTVALSAAAVARADGYQTTSPDACDVLSGAAVRRALGKGVARHPERFELPELSAHDPDVNHVLDVSRTSCTWIVGSPSLAGTFAVVNVQVYERNTSYSGAGEPWTPDEEAVAFVRGAQRLINNDRLAKRLEAPWLRGNDVWVAVDAATRGQRIANVAIRRGDELFVVFSVLTRKRNALTIAVKATKGTL